MRPPNPLATSLPLLLLLMPLAEPDQTAALVTEEIVRGSHYLCHDTFRHSQLLRLDHSLPLKSEVD